MAVTGEAAKVTCKLVRFGLTTADADALATFYERALDCQRLAEDRLSGPHFAKLAAVAGGAKRITLLLGREILELFQFDDPGRPYPLPSAASDLIFQHFAIVVSDMRQAMQRLDAIGRWSTITRQGPQTLPKSSGGVTAFKFRDPEGHPLELLSFPADKAPSKWRHADKLAFLGIDHSAISVVDTEISQRFYENFGLRVSARSLNQGPEQDNLDDLFNTCVEVTALSATNDGPHIELLCYRREAQTGASVRSSNDIAATRLILESDTPAEIADVTGKSVLDPDGHHLTILHSSALLRPQ